MSRYFAALVSVFFVSISQVLNASESHFEPQVIIEGEDPYRSGIADDMRKDGWRLGRALDALLVIFESDEETLNELLAIRQDLSLKYEELLKKEAYVWGAGMSLLGFGNRPKIKKLIAIIDDGIGRSSMSSSK